MILETDIAKIYFGSAADEINKSDREDCFKKFEILKNKLGAKDILFLNQVHGKDFLVAHDKSKIEFKSFDYSGDIIVSNQKCLAIGVLTADCLPIVILDFAKKVSAVAHAGWRGTLLGCTIKTIQVLKENFDCCIGDLKIYFGPAAKSCCYEVGEDFVLNLKANKIEASLFIEKRDNKFFFDLIKLNKFQLKKIGILENQIDEKKCICTMCNQNFYSYRRDKSDGRQASVVMIK